MVLLLNKSATLYLDLRFDDLDTCPKFREPSCRLYTLLDVVGNSSLKRFGSGGSANLNCTRQRVPSRRTIQIRRLFIISSPSFLSIFITVDNIALSVQGRRGVRLLDGGFVRLGVVHLHLGGHR